MLSNQQSFGGRVRLWGIHIMCICGDEVSKNVNFRPIDSIYVTHITYLNLRTVHRGLAPLGQVKDWPYGPSTLGQVKDCL